ncbi:Mak10-domain-containing protein [Auriscalpium vulgare]|uniref:Mak10-domain-containing protein n=1 Tax=Auriscalpium vulgare TaxID=40419 RepID=A0ACB8RT64_9AGAM|nr:Mak10-domain-containing protein [Auriscalpium vulgare]
MSYALPGGDGFTDVAEIFLEASGDMDPEELIFTEGFTLYDSMSALEIGDPRMDSGMALDDEQRPPFEPLAPLLPEELCYILDRMIACEMEWHAGFTLSQTVFTCLHVHHLEYISPDVVPLHVQLQEDPVRPLDLVTIVLRAAVAGMLKCCDFAWREMSKGRVQDTEDWQSEKCSVSLLEGTPAGVVHAWLEHARTWLVRHAPSSMSCREGLLDRILLRSQLLELFRLDPIADRPQFATLLATASTLLQSIRSRPEIPPPGRDSAGFLAFDPHITRRLNSFMPLRVLSIPDQDTSWDALESLLRGWADLCDLTDGENLLTWKVVGDLWATLAPPRRRVPFLRSLAQSCFFDGYRIVGDKLPRWLVDQFFQDTVGIEYQSIWTTVNNRWVGDTPPLKDIEQKLIRILIAYNKSSWFNPPRRRRYLSRSLLEWHVLYDSATQLIEKLQITDESELSLVRAVPRAVLLWRLSTLRELVLAGFSLELYVPDERPMAYWYAAQVVRRHLSVLQEVEAAPSEALAQEILFNRTYLTALESMCTAMFLITLPLLKCDTTRLSLNFLRRYKWAFRWEYKQILTPPVLLPDLQEFLSACSTALENETLSPSAYFLQAKAALSELKTSLSGWASRWHTERLHFIQDLSVIAGLLAEVTPTSLDGLPTFDQRMLDWAPSRYRWFPSIRAV